MSKEYISISDAAREKGCARNSIYVAIATKKLDSEVIAGKPVILKNDKFNIYKPKKGVLK